MASKTFLVQPLEERLAAFRRLQKMKETGTSRAAITQVLFEEYQVKRPTIKRWLNGYSPYGRNLGRILIVPEFFYVLGAILGDGCIYFWRHLYQVWVHGEQEFVEKYADKVSKCLPLHRQVPSYKRRNVNVSFVKIDNAELYFWVRKIRADLREIQSLLNIGNRNVNALQFMEGFFDAEGCVKIINDKARTIPKICLDFTNTNLALQQIVRLLLLEELGIESGISIQNPGGNRKKTAYHLRIYRKNGVRKFVENIPTIKMKGDKLDLVKKWLEKENWRGKANV